MKERRLSLLVLSGVLLCCGTASVMASPSQWSGNGHWYEVIVTDTAISWTDSLTAAQASSHLGVQGNLASITSAEENNFVADLIDAANGWVYNGLNGFFGPWIGGYQPQESYWAWIDGETWGDTQWESNQPTNQTDQDYVHYYVKLANSGDPEAEPATWNDYTDTADKVFGYVVEYDCANTVPAPTALLLLGTGLASLARVRRKFSK